jgi:putative PIN family toxin of toxin-antitoxin system
MRVVVDTNVLVSAFMNPDGTPRRIVDLLLVRAFVVLIDNRIVEEYREVLLRPSFAFDLSDVGLLLDFVEHAGEYVVAGHLDLLLPDPTDLPFLEVAAIGQADALITGNIRDFKPTRGRHSVNVCSPADFFRQLP